MADIEAQFFELKPESSGSEGHAVESEDQQRENASCCD